MLIIRALHELQSPAIPQEFLKLRRQPTAEVLWTRGQLLPDESIVRRVGFRDAVARPGEPAWREQVNQHERQRFEVVSPGRDCLFNGAYKRCCSETPKV
jgi:hypothetical protein